VWGRTTGFCPLKERRRCLYCPDPCGAEEKMDYMEEFPPGLLPDEVNPGG